MSAVKRFRLGRLRERGEKSKVPFAEPSPAPDLPGAGVRTRGRFRAADSAARLDHAIDQNDRFVDEPSERPGRSRPPRHRSPWRPAASIHRRISTSGRARRCSSRVDESESRLKRREQASRWRETARDSPTSSRKRSSSFSQICSMDSIAHAQPRARGPMGCHRACGRSSRHPRRSHVVKRNSGAASVARSTNSRTDSVANQPFRDGRRPAHPETERAMPRRPPAVPSRSRLVTSTHIAGLPAASARSARRTQGSTVSQLSSTISISISRGSAQALLMRRRTRSRTPRIVATIRATRSGR